ncbi:MAG: hypothetical protein N0E59_02060 [Candidatus Thiodiazotropha taylori]|nr:hypothetical protein [Candidatus Thiodiazotropha taylori]MCG8092599.1 hypothetical protein [Candidatus Thiodiazotropha endolucinida]MCG8109526.1 hypothetical protein [Candidatus Thiodiazotropha taylori]MCW4281867.1 hypothetical protein [Candidatus Thiodiazotropha taylori]MCW4305939.1 hypothetical protein [Candidatus Thiodiazotropha taylori]
MQPNEITRLIFSMHSMSMTNPTFKPIGEYENDEVASFLRPYRERSSALKNIFANIHISNEDGTYELQGRMFHSNIEESSGVLHVCDNSGFCILILSDRTGLLGGYGPKGEKIQLGRLPHLDVDSSFFLSLGDILRDSFSFVKLTDMHEDIVQLRSRRAKVCINRQADQVDSFVLYDNWSGESRSAQIINYLDAPIGAELPVDMEWDILNVNDKYPVRLRQHLTDVMVNDVNLTLKNFVPTEMIVMPGARSERPG